MYSHETPLDPVIFFALISQECFFFFHSVAEAIRKKIYLSFCFISRQVNANAVFVL